MTILSWTEQVTPAGTDKHLVTGQGWHGRVAYIGGRIGYVATLWANDTTVWEARNLGTISDAKYQLTIAARERGLL